MKIKFLLIMLTLLYSHLAVSSDDYIGYKKALMGEEDVSLFPPSKIKNKLLTKEVFFKRKENTYQFGVTSIDAPFFDVNDDSGKIDTVYSLLSLIGVDSVKSSAADWSKLGDDKNHKNFKMLKFQLDEAKKYNLSSSFIIGYPPVGMGVYSKSIRTAVSNKYMVNYEDYLRFIVKYLKPYDVKYFEVGNEVDAGSHWWIHSTPTMYVNEVKQLKKILIDLSSNIKIAAFSATYARSSSNNTPHEGRKFIQESLDLGINSYVDAYSLHHFTFPNDDGLIGFFKQELINRNIQKPLIDTEQMDVTDNHMFFSKPYQIIKLYAYGFFKYNLKHIDYFMARDAFIEPKVYPVGFTQGLFDMNWNPKPRLLALAMSIDAMKGRSLIKSGEIDGLVYFLLRDKLAISKYKYSLLLWRDGDANINIDIGQNQTAETWSLDELKANSHYSLTDAPLVIFSNDVNSFSHQIP